MTEPVNQNDQQQPAADDVDTDRLEWTTHPVQRRPLISAAVSMFIVVVTVGIYFSLDSVGFALLAMLVLFGSLAKFYFPTHYILDRQKITVKTTTQTLHKSWSLYRSSYPDKNGVFVSPFVDRSRLENFRGLYLMCENNRDEVAAYVKTCIATAQQNEQTKQKSENR